MNEKMYVKDNLVVINFNKGYVSTPAQLLNSTTFKNVVENFIEHLKEQDYELYVWALNHHVPRVAKVEITNVFRQLLVFGVDEIDSYYLRNKELLLKFIEALYSYWKSFQRFTINDRGNSVGLAGRSFVDADADFNRLVRSTYRLLEEKVKGRRNLVYRQLQAGSNAAILLRDSEKSFTGAYEKLNSISMIDSIMLRTPMILYPKSNKREGAFEQVFENPIDRFSGMEDYTCYPAKVGTLLAYIYVHKDFIASQIALSNLFELANEDECKKPDLIMLFGVDNGKGCRFYHDAENELWVGAVTYDEKIEYFGYLKKMTLTLFNCAMMAKKALPIHGAFVSVRLRSGVRKNVMLIGDSGAGKSETIEALKNLGNEQIVDIDVIFDDMGTLSIQDDFLYGQGSEIGAFIRLDDLDKGSPYKEIDRSIFMNPQTTNARVIVPAAPYALIVKKHLVDCVLYANNYDQEVGLHFFNDPSQAIDVFKQGKRMAKGTTDEVGITTTYFANPFGPMQLQAVCDGLIETTFAKLYDLHIPVGQIYTQLGFNGTGLADSAKALLEWISHDTTQ
ncbi:MAG: hypothetical protein ACRDBX_07085 [Erysipelotrichaceae bacterium]